MAAGLHRPEELRAVRVRGALGDVDFTGRKEIRSCTIITTEANELLRPIHGRMPVILSREAEAVWLNPTIEEPEALLPLLKPYPAEKMEWYPVSTRVNNPANDGRECREPTHEGN